MESELIAGALEKVQDENAYFQKLKKELEVESNEAILAKKLDGIDVLFEPSPNAFEEVLRKRAELVRFEIESCRKVLSLLEDLRNLPWASSLKVTVFIEPNDAKVLLKIR